MKGDGTHRDFCMGCWGGGLVGDARLLAVAADTLLVESLLALLLGDELGGPRLGDGVARDILEGHRRAGVGSLIRLESLGHWYQAARGT